ncbi:tRNA-splicing endonuclease subunit Sen2-like [Ciona intestinalis]
MAIFRPPQKKKGASKEFFTPLPVPIASVNKTVPKLELWSYYDGHLKEDHVKVELKGDIHCLHTQGFFGRLVKTATQNDKPTEDEKSELFTDCKSSDTSASHDSCPDKSSGQSSTNSTQHNQHETALPAKVEEILVLTYEEAFFLSYGLGCLFVKDHNGENLNIEQQWEVFCKRNMRFTVTYCAYHHFRSKGWVPRDGIRYGGDLVLYRKGPPYYHASYIVIIVSVDAETLQETVFRAAKNRTFSWPTMSGQLRLATSVSKEVMLCHVLVPRKCLKSNSCDVSCLKNFQVKETIVSRWISTKEREKELLDIDCDF